MLNVISVSVKSRLNDVSFRARTQEWTSLVGVNGAGKSTLLAVCAGVIAPDDGHVLFHEQPLTRSVWSERGIALVRAQPDDGFVAPTVFEEVAFALRAHHIRTAEIRTRVNNLLERLSLTQVADMHPFYLSGGEQHRVALAARLILRPQFLLLDEISAMLDDRTHRDLLNTLHTIQQTEGCGILMASHRPQDLFFAQRVLVLVNGSIAADDTPDRVIAQAADHPEWQLKEAGCLPL